MWNRGIVRTLWDNLNGRSWSNQATDKELVKGFRRIPEMYDYFQMEKYTQEIFDEMKDRLKKSPDGHPKLKPFIEAHATLPENGQDDFSARTLIGAVDGMRKAASDTLIKSVSMGTNVSTTQPTAEP